MKLKVMYSTLFTCPCGVCFIHYGSNCQNKQISSQYLLLFFDWPMTFSIKTAWIFSGAKPKEPFWPGDGLNIEELEITIVIYSLVSDLVQKAFPLFPRICVWFKYGGWIASKFELATCAACNSCKTTEQLSVGPLMHVHRSPQPR